MKPDVQDKLRQLPSVAEVDQHLSARGLPSGKPVRARVEAVLNETRAAILAGTDAAPARDALLARLEQAVAAPAPNALRRVINATGVVVHTNLGRSPLAPAHLQAAAALSQGYTNLEFDLATGQRGGRGGQIPELLAQLSGAEAGLVVNNNASAVMLMLSALAAGKEVIVSRGELVEIGGSFRVPDILRASGARLVEVGTTNRTRASDYAHAIGPETAALLKVHRSNFTMSGFVEEASVAELAAVGREHGLPVWHDLGSATFYRFRQPALSAIPTAAQEVAAGADVLCFSGDKVLGGVQAGLVVGRREAVERMRKHPLYRVLRVDKLRAVLLEAVLRDYLDPAGVPERVPTIGLMERTVADLQPLGAALLKALPAQPAGPLRWELTPHESLPGGGALPEVRLPSLALALSWEGPVNGTAPDEALATHLRANDPPIIATRREGRVLLDLRTVLEADLSDLSTALQRLATEA